MNAERKKILIDAIKSKKLGFDMQTWRMTNEDGPVACIGGHCSFVMGDPDKVEHRFTTACARWLEIDPRVAKRLFFPYKLRDWEKITRDDAVLAIENVAKYDDPRWAAIRPDLTVEDRE